MTKLALVASRKGQSFRRISSAWILVAAIFCVPSATFAVAPIDEEAYCFAVADSGDNLVFIQKDGGGFLDMGGTGTGAMEAIAFNPDDGMLYATDGDDFGFLDYDDSFDTDGNDSEFIETSADVGTCTLPGGGTVTINDVDGLQFDITRTDAGTGTFVLWASARDGDGAAPDDVLFQIDPGTGLVDTSPTPGFTGGATCVRVSGPGILVDVDDVAIDPLDGTIYAVNNIGGGIDQLITIDPVTGAGTIVGTFFNPLLQVEDMEGLSFGADGQLYGTTGAGNEFFLLDKSNALSIPIVAFPSLGDYEAVACLTDNLITGTVFFDADADGVLDFGMGDSGFQGATVLVYIDENNDGLVDGGDTLACDNPTDGYNLPCPTTDPNGFYRFVVGQGNYSVEVDTSSLPAGHSLTTDNDEEADFSVTDFGQTDPDNDFGFNVPSGAGALDITKTSDVAPATVVQGQTITYTITITNNTGITHKDIRLADVLPAGVVYDPMSTVATGPVGELFQVRDEFGTASYANQDGRDDWAANWVETDAEGAAQSPTAGEVQIVAGELRMENATLANFPAVERSVDLSTFAGQGALLNFDFRLGPGVDDTQDDVVVEASTGGAFTQIHSISGIDGPAFGRRTLDLTAFISATTTVRWRIADDYDGTGEFFYLDNVEIVAGDNYRDELDNAVLNQQDGSLSWATDWIEIGEVDGAGNDDGQIGLTDPDFGGRQVMRIRDNDGGGVGFEREADLSSAEQALLTFEWRRTDLDDADDYATIDVSDDGGASWTEVARLDGAADDADYTPAVIDITPFTSSNTRIRFLGSPDLGGGDEIYFDNINILIPEVNSTTKDNVPVGVNLDLVDGVPTNVVDPDDGYLLRDTDTLTVTMRVVVENPLDPYKSSLLNTATVTSNRGGAVAYHADPVVSGTIGDRVWHDIDRDSIQDVGEPGLANVDVVLYVDDDGTPGPSVGDTLFATTTTDQYGKYLFFGLPPGTYYTDVDGADIPTGLVLNPDCVLTVSPCVDPSSLRTVVKNDTFLDLDFGYVNTDPTMAIIGDRIWSDANEDGVQDPGEPGIGSVTVNLVDPGPDGVVGTGDDTVVATTVTAADGSYLFTGIAPGSYIVEVDETSPALSGYAVTSGPQSPGSNLSNPITVLPGDTYLNADFGYFQAGLGQIGNSVFLDENGDGVLQPGTEEGIPGVTVTLVQDTNGNGVLDPGEPIIATTITDSLGKYQFEGLNLDDGGGDAAYLIQITDEFGQTSPYSKTLGPMAAMDDNSQADPYSVTLTPGTPTNQTADFGFSPAGIVGDQLWSDADGDGVFDPGEAGISGIEMALVSDPGPDLMFGTTDDVVDQVVTTGPDGTYLFVGVTPESYVVIADVGNDGIPGNGDDGESAAAGYAQTGDPDEVGTCVTCDGQGTATVTDTAGDLTMDFGYQNTALPDISGNVFEDFDRDGVDDGVGEPGFGEVTVELRDAAGNVVATTTTDAAGDYDFPDVPAGDYTVAVTDTAGILTDYDLTSGFDELPVTVVATDITGIDFGYDRDSANGVIGDYVWFDADRNGVQNGGEVGIGGVTLELFNTGPDGMIGGGDDFSVGTVDTLPDGSYQFTGLPPGNYYVDPDETTLPAGLSATTGTGGDSGVINLSAGERELDADFGYASTAGVAIGDTIFHDASDDGFQQRGELGLGGVTVRVFTGGCGGTLVGSDVSDATGNWLVTGLTAGTEYFVCVDTTTGDIAALGLDPIQTTFNGGPPEENFVPLPGQDLLQADFGFKDDGANTTSIGDTIYLDQNGNATQDGEPGLEGVTVALVDLGPDMMPGGGDDVVLGTTVTDASGNYLFSGVDPGGDYQVVVTDQNGVVADLNPTETEGVIPAASLTAGVPFLDADFGYAPSGGTGSIGDFVWRDLDSSGDYQIGEPGIGGVTIDLWLDNNGNGVIEPGIDNKIRTTITDSQGYYEFLALETAGGVDYIVDVTDKQGVLDGLTQTFGIPGVNDNGQTEPYPVTLDTASPTNNTADFSYEASTSLQVTGLVYFDVDGNGVLDGIDRGVGGVTVFLYRDLDGDGVGDVLFDTVLTDADGNYVFPDVPGSGDDLNPFDYVVNVDLFGTFLRGSIETQTGTGKQTPALGTMDSNDNDFGFTFPATLVLVSSLRSYSDHGAVVVELETASQLGSIGFWLWRLDPRSGEYLQVNDEILPAAMAPQGAVYRWVDEGASTRSNSYVVYEGEMGGGERVYGPFESVVEPMGDREPMAGRSFSMAERQPAQADVRRLRQAESQRRLHAVRAQPLEPQASELRVESAASRPSAVKVEVTAAGIQYVSASQLASSLSVKTSKIKKSIGSGKMLVEHFGQDGWQSVVWTAAAGNRGLYFRGVASESVYSDSSVYRVREKKGPSMSSVAGGSPSPQVSATGFESTVHYEEQVLGATFASRDPEMDFWYWAGMIAGHSTLGSADLEIDVADPVGGYPALLSLRFYSANNSLAELDHRVSIAVNGLAIGVTEWGGMAHNEVDLAVPSGVLVAGNNTVTVTAELGPGVTTSFVYVDRIDLRYQRHYRAVADRLELRGDGNPVVTVSGFTTPEIEVYELRDARPPRKLTATTIDKSDGYRVSFVPRNKNRRYEVVGVAGARAVDTTPWLEQKISGKGAEYVVITPGHLREGADRLADYRDSQGLETTVLELEAIYNSRGGERTPRAIAELLRQAFREWRTPPRYVTLIGKGSFDYNDYLGFGGNLLPPLLASTPMGLYASDGLFGDVTGDDGVPELAVGRIAVLTLEELHSYVDKLIAYEQPGTAPGGDRVLLLADNADSGGDFTASSELISQQIPRTFAQSKIYLDELSIDDARASLFSLLDEGSHLVNYIGHGGIDRLAAESLMAVDDVTSLDNGGGLPVFVSMTCSVGRFELPGFVSLAEALTIAPERGAIAVFGPSGTSINSEAEQINQIFLEALLGHGGKRLGDVTLETLRSYGFDGRLPFVSTIYNLIGDPALVID